MQLQNFLIVVISSIGLASSALAEDERYRVTLVGDSITNGAPFGAVTGGGTEWASILAQALAFTHAVDNVGCGGTTTTDWTISAGGSLCGNRALSQIIFAERALPSLPSDFATVMLGTNDALGFFEPEPVSPALYRANLDEIVDELLAAGARTVVLMSPPPQCAPSQASLLLTLYRAQGIDLCLGDPDVICGVDTFNLLDSSDFVGCNVHPTQSGHLKIFFELKQVLLDHEPQAPDIEVFAWTTLSALSPSALLPVVVYSEAEFDAPAQIDAATLRFGATGWEDSLLSASGAPACVSLDVDADGLQDLACAFAVIASGLDLDSQQAFLRGRTQNGSAVDAGASGSASELAPFPPNLIALIEAAF